MGCVRAPWGEGFTFNVDIGFSGGGDALRVVSFTAELSVLVHTCNGHIGEDNVDLQCCFNSEQLILMVAIALNVLANQPSRQLLFNISHCGEKSQVDTIFCGSAFGTNSRTKSFQKVLCQPQQQRETWDDSFLHYTSTAHTSQPHIQGTQTEPLQCVMYRHNNPFAPSLSVDTQFPSFSSHRSAQLE